YVFDRAVFDGPALVGHLFPSKPTPPVPRLAIEQELPPCCLLVLGESVYSRASSFLSLRLRFSLRRFINRRFVREEDDRKGKNKCYPCQDRAIGDFQSHISS